MVKVGKWIAKHRVLMLIIGFLLIIPSVIGMAKTRVNYDLLSYLPEHLETVKGQDILVDEYGMGAFSMVVVENMDMKDVQKLEDQFSEVPHVKDVLWYDDVADISLPVEMIPKDLKEAFFKGDATMMLVLFDNTTSSDEAMDAVGQMRKLANDQCFISGMTGVVTDIKNLALKELPVYVVIAALLSLVVLELTSGSFVVPILWACDSLQSWKQHFLWRDFVYHKGIDCGIAAGCDNGLFHFPLEQLRGKQEAFSGRERTCHGTCDFQYI